VVARAAPVVVQALVALLEPLDTEIRGADECRRRIGLLTDFEREAVDREGVGECGRFEIDVQAAVQIECRLAVDPPPAGSIRFQRHFARA
jgi:hypothetical protein